MLFTKRQWQHSYFSVWIRLSESLKYDYIVISFALLNPSPLSNHILVFSQQTLFFYGIYMNQGYHKNEYHVNNNIRVIRVIRTDRQRGLGNQGYITLITLITLVALIALITTSLLNI